MAGEHNQGGIPTDAVIEATHPPRRGRAALGVAVGLGIALAACSSDGDSSETTMPDLSTTTTVTEVTSVPTTLPTPTTMILPETTAAVLPSTVPTTETSVAPGVTTTPAPEDCVSGHDIRAVRWYLTKDGLVELTPSRNVVEVDTGEHDRPEDGCPSFEQITIRLKDSGEPGSIWPGLTVEYIDGEITNANTGEPVPVEGDATLLVRIGADLHTDDGSQFVERRITNPDLEMIQEIAVYEDFEGYGGFVVGLPHEMNFSVEDESGFEGCEDGCYVIKLYEDVPVLEAK